MKDQYQLYGVMVDGKYGQFLAAGTSGRWLSDTHRNAVNFAKELREHIGAKCRVVRVSVTYEWEAK